MRLEQVLESNGLARWKDDSSQLRLTRGQFLDILAELIGKDTEILAAKKDVETMFERRREGAAWAVLTAHDAGLLSRKGMLLVDEWKKRILSGYPDLEVGEVRLVPPDPPKTQPGQSVASE